MKTYIIPLTAEPQSFPITLGAVDYNLTVVWSEVAQVWQLNLDDGAGVRVLSSIPLVASTNLLEQYAYLGIGGELYAETDGSPNVAPTFDNLGDAGKLYFVVP